MLIAHRHFARIYKRICSESRLEPKFKISVSRCRLHNRVRSPYVKPLCTHTKEVLIFFFFFASFIESFDDDLRADFTLYFDDKTLKLEFQLEPFIPKKFYCVICSKNVHHTVLVRGTSFSGIKRSGGSRISSKNKE